MNAPFWLASCTIVIDNPDPFSADATGEVRRPIDPMTGSRDMTERDDRVNRDDRER